MGSSPTIGTEMDCSTAQKNINNFLRETLIGNELRRTYYHLKECEKCREVLLDEFSFYTTFNDLDRDLDFNYERNLNRFMNKIGDRIKSHDSSLISRYVLMSIIICISFVAIITIALRIVYS